MAPEERPSSRDAAGSPSIWKRRVPLSGATALLIVGSALYQWHRVEAESRERERVQEEREEALRSRRQEVARQHERAMAQLKEAVMAYGAEGLRMPYVPEGAAPAPATHAANARE